MSKYIAIPFPLLEAAGITNGLLAAIVRRGFELGLSQDELPWSGITPRSYRWTENPAQDGSDDTLIRFTLWGGGCGFYAHGTLRGVNGHYGTSWAMEAFEVHFRQEGGWARDRKSLIRMDADQIPAVLAGQGASALDAALTPLVSAVMVERERRTSWLAENPPTSSEIGDED